MTLEKVSLVLSGGFANGAYEFGILKYLDEHRQEIQVTDIMGTSIGCLNAVAYASDTMKKAEDLWINTNFKGFIEVYRHFVQQYIIDDYLDDILDYTVLKKSGIKLHVVLSTFPTFRVALRQVTYEDAEQLKYLLLTAVNMPLCMPTKRIDNRRVIDGGFTANTPLNQLSYLPDRQPILLVHFEPKPIIDEFDQLIYEFYYSKENRTFRDMLDFSKENVQKMIAIGYEDIREFHQTGTLNMHRRHTQSKYINPHYLLRKWSTLVQKNHIRLG